MLLELHTLCHAFHHGVFDSMFVHPVTVLGLINFYYQHCLLCGICPVFYTPENNISSDWVQFVSAFGAAEGCCCLGEQHAFMTYHHVAEPRKLVGLQAPESSTVNGLGYPSTPTCCGTMCQSATWLGHTSSSKERTVGTYVCSANTCARVSHGISVADSM